MNLFSRYRKCLFALSLACLELFVPIRVGAYIDEGLPSLAHFMPYKPIYFLVGTPDTKIQVSLKIQPLNEIPVYFGYTQHLMWDLFKTSAPIRDINYNPELFGRVPLGDSNSRRWLDVSPYEHESNGKGSVESRSWNRGYLRYTDAGKNFQWSLKLWLVYPGADNQTPDFRGLGELTLSLTDFLGEFWTRGDILLRIYPGGTSKFNPTLGGQELTIRFKAREPHVLPLFVVQGFHGYGENLLEANEERWAIRGGIGL